MYIYICIYIYILHDHIKLHYIYIHICIWFHIIYVIPYHIYSYILRTMFLAAPSRWSDLVTSGVPLQKKPVTVPTEADALMWALADIWYCGWFCGIRNPQQLKTMFFHPIVHRVDAPSFWWFIGFRWPIHSEFLQFGGQEDEALQWRLIDGVFHPSKSKKRCI